MEEQIFNDQDYQNFENPEPKRPFALAFACVLSFISAGFNCISNLFSFLFYNTIQTLGQDEEYLELMEKFVPDTSEMEAAMQAQLAVSRVSYLLMALLYAASFFGVLQMWKMQKKGFHIYTIAQLLMLIVTAIFVTSVTGESIVGAAVLAAIWIGIYFIFYKKYMK